MPRPVVAAAVCALLTCAAASASADKPPDAARVRQAAEQFDAGVAAFKQKDFEGAASRFEAADAAVPSETALRQAIRARAEAGQSSRAATLAALALARYPESDVTAKLAGETIAKAEPLVHKVRVSCLSPCVLALGTRSVPGEASTRWTVYLDPGKVTLGASFLGGAGSVERRVVATAGGSSELRVEPEEKKKLAPPPDAASTKDTAKAETPPDALPSDPATPDQPAKSRGIHPAVFITSLVATAALGGVTVWSGLDTEKNPGPDAVRKGCVGQGESCALYQQGLASQLRTNVFIGATAGVGALTVVFAILTRWHSAKKPEGGASAAPSALITDRGAVLGASGAF